MGRGTDHRLDNKVNAAVGQGMVTAVEEREAGAGDRKTDVRAEPWELQGPGFGEMRRNQQRRLGQGSHRGQQGLRARTREKEDTRGCALCRAPDQRERYNRLLGL